MKIFNTLNNQSGELLSTLLAGIFLLITSLYFFGAMNTQEKSIQNSGFIQSANCDKANQYIISNFSTGNYKIRTLNPQKDIIYNTSNASDPLSTTNNNFRDQFPLIESISNSTSETKYLFKSRLHYNNRSLNSYSVSNLFKNMTPIDGKPCERKIENYLSENHIYPFVLPQSINNFNLYVKTIVKVPDDFCGVLGTFDPNSFDYTLSIQAKLPPVNGELAEHLCPKSSEFSIFSSAATTVSKVGVEYIKAGNNYLCHSDNTKSCSFDLGLTTSSCLQCTPTRSYKTGGANEVVISTINSQAGSLNTCREPTLADLTNNYSSINLPMTHNNDTLNIKNLIVKIFSIQTALAFAPLFEAIKSLNCISNSLSAAEDCSYTMKLNSTRFNNWDLCDGIRLQGGHQMELINLNEGEKSLSLFNSKSYTNQYRIILSNKNNYCNAVQISSLNLSNIPSTSDIWHFYKTSATADSLSVNVDGMNPYVMSICPAGTFKN